MPYSLANVLAVAKNHPFYNTNVLYPPDLDQLDALVHESTTSSSTTANSESELNFWPLLNKKKLYSTIQRLVHDTSPQNTYRHAVYASVTGGGRTEGTPLFFATDVYENRRQRAAFGYLLASTGVVKRGDWVVSMHTAGDLYRALDLMLETIECAGGCCLAAGAYMTPSAVVQLLIDYRANVLTGDSSQIVNMANYLASQSPPAERARVHVDKIIYTSEVLTAAQRRHVRAVFGPRVAICSALASAECGPWAVSNPAITGDRTTAESDFIFDARTINVQVFAPDVALEPAENDEEALFNAASTPPPPPPPPQPLPQGETGLIALTSLCRLRNPLVRYLSGDVGSVHPLPAAAAAALAVPDADRPHMRLLHLHGRDGRFSFDWEGEYIDLANLAAIVETPAYGVLQWQAVIDNAPPDETNGADTDTDIVTTKLRPRLTLRILQSPTAAADADVLAGRKEMVSRIKTLLVMQPLHEKRFVPQFLDSLAGFEKSKTGGKVIRYINRII